MLNASHRRARANAAAHLSMPPSAPGAGARSCPCVNTAGRRQHPARFAGALLEFASPTLTEHLVRGALGAAALALGVMLLPVQPWAALATLPIAFVALRGCPMCWTVGLLDTIVGGGRRPIRSERQKPFSFLGDEPANTTLHTAGADARPVA